MDMIRTFARVVTGLSHRLQEGLGPWLDLAIRLWLAQAFLVVDVRAMMLGPSPSLTAPFGAGWWLTAVHGITGSTAGLAVGTVCSLLLAAGLLARPASVAMLVQTVLMPAAAASGSRLFWAALLVRLIVVGAGTLSIDTLLRRGLESSAVPGAHRAAKASSALRWRGGPLYLLGLRLWLATAIAGMALAALDVTGAMELGLPQVPAMIAGLAPIAALAAAPRSSSAVSRPGLPRWRCWRWCRLDSWPGSPTQDCHGLCYSACCWCRGPGRSRSIVSSTFGSVG